ncbi:hypothetical protein KKE06_05035 [Candidatus Micrarchaeota archaeon]|nr:hypothetical protein [Candidatus Micrarchaeota archaeon]MBU1930237.1 hypothetical protein [Candidatus Micrarchaeota archaeon]
MDKKESLESLLDPEKRVEVKLESALSEIKKPNVVLVVIESDHYSAIQTGLLDFLKKRSDNGVFVSVNKALVNLFDSPQKVLEDQKTVFVDLVSETAGTEKLSGENVHYLESPKNLLELTMQIEQALEKNPKNQQFLILDSLSTLLLYNKPEPLEKFVHQLVGKIRGLQALGIFLMVRLKENQDTIRVISQFCDHTIEITENESRTE